MWGFTKLFRDLGWQKFCSLNPMASEVTLYAPPPPPPPPWNRQRREWERRERFLRAGVQSDDTLPSHLSPLTRTQCCGHTSHLGSLGNVASCVYAQQGGGAWIGCGYLPPYRCLPASIPTQSQNSTQRGVCLFLRLMIINNLRQEGRGQGAIVKSMTQLLRSGYNKNQLEPIRPKMAEDWISSGHWASVYTLCITLINDTPTSYMTVSGPRHQCCPSS